MCTIDLYDLLLNNCDLSNKSIILVQTLTLDSPNNFASLSICSLALFLVTVFLYS